MNRGEVWWGEDPEAGRRPFVILTRQEAIPLLRRVVVAPVTRTIRDIPSEVILSEKDGMPTRCAVTLDNVATVSTALLTERITRLRGDRMIEVCRALRAATAC